MELEEGLSYAPFLIFSQPKAFHETDYQSRHKNQQ